MSEVGPRHGLVSVGYQGRTLDELVAALVVVGTATLADVRLNPVSRKPGFSRTRLRDALAAHGIGYEHLRSLGNARDNREPFRTGREAQGREAYRRAIAGVEARDALGELAARAAVEVVAVLCFEADEAACHRQVVIEEILRIRPVPVLRLGDGQTAGGAPGRETGSSR